ncbi:MAG: hypothetical protein GC181_14940 [Bacteroidetes bacterium]|nr:hypothetical protein [Bacteroidota bacterium]
MKIKSITSIVILALVCNVVSAQSDQDAYRYSSNDIGTTARSMGSAGAFGSLGADISSVSINPAGIGLYRSNSFVLGFGMKNAKSSSQYLNNATKDNDFSLNMPNIGLVFNKTKYDGRSPAKSGWLNTNFAITFNRVNDFNKVVNYSGLNPQSSMLEYFAERVNGIPASQLGATDDELTYGYKDVETMAWESYLIDTVSDRQYVANLDPLDRNLNQRNTISSSGGMNEIGFTLSSNYENKFYLGGGIQLTTVRYKETNRYSEEDKSNNFNNWNIWQLTQNLTTSGLGVSGNMGLIYRAAKNLRMGASIKTPTVFSLTDKYNDELSAQYDDGGSLNLKSVDGTYDYKVLTPMKTTLSACYLFGKNGFISTDVEFSDYSSMRLKPYVNAFETANDLIRSKYSNTVNIRVGGEYVKDMFRFRAGVAHYQSPLFNVTDNNLSKLYLTGGMGIHDKNWALDFALVQKRTLEIRQPYTLESKDVSYSKNNLTQNSIVITLSSRF